MGQYVDNYFLVNNRDSSIIKRFLERFLPYREEAAEDYPVREYDDNPISVYKDIEELFTYLEEHEDETYSIYWYNEKENMLKNAMFFYTNDNKIILGISVSGNSPEDPKVVEYYNSISAFLDSDIGCLTVEEAPPANSLEFIEFCNKRYKPN